MGSDLGAAALGVGRASESRDDRDDAVAPGVAGVRSRNSTYVDKPPPIAIARITAMIRMRPLTLRFYGERRSLYDSTVSGAHLNDSLRVPCSTRMTARENLHESATRDRHSRRVPVYSGAGERPGGLYWSVGAALPRGHDRADPWP